MTTNTATTYTLDSRNLLHRADGRFATRVERQTWEAVVAQAFKSWIVVCGCELGLVWAELEACETLAVKASSLVTSVMVDPMTGEEEHVPVGEISTYYPLMPSTWVGCITWESTDLYPEVGTLTVCNKLGNPVFCHKNQTTKTLLSILRADKVAKSTGLRSIGATVHHYFGRKAPKVGIAASYDPFTRPAVVNGQLVNVNL